MELDFYKLQFYGNDYIFVNTMITESPTREKSEGIAAEICQRSTGVGANGMIFFRQNLDDEGGYFSIDVYDSNGEPLSVSYDSLLCTARYAFDFGLFNEKELKIKSESGEHIIQSIDSNNFRISLGVPRTFDSSHNLTERPDGEYAQRWTIDQDEYVFTPVRFERVIAVMFADKRSTPELRRLASQFNKSFHSAAEERLHPIFVSLYSREEFRMHEWYSLIPKDICTSVASATVGCVVNGVLERDVVVHHKRGELYVQWLEENNKVYVTGEPCYVFSGTYHYDFQRSSNTGHYQ